MTVGDAAEPGWQRFLTERDRQHLLRTQGPAGKQPFGFGERPAVLVVDDYYAVLGFERQPLLESTGRWPMSCGAEGWTAIDRTVDLLSAARAAGTPIIYITILAAFPSPWFRGTRDRLDHLGDAERARAYEIVDEIAPQPGDLVIPKSAPSAFQGTPLIFHLNALAIDTLIVCGETTSGCVRATVVDGATHRYRMGVVTDCVFDRTEASHWMSLFDMDQKYADVVSLDAAVSYLGRTSARRPGGPVGEPGPTMSNRSCSEYVL